MPCRRGYLQTSMTTKHESPDTSRRMRAHGFVLAALLATLVACGGGTGTPNDAGNTPPPAGPPPSPPATPPALAGGVLATFTVGAEQFKAWVTEPGTATALAAAWGGSGPAVTSVCAYVDPGSGQGAHNAPWSWSIAPARGINFTGLCIGCALAWTTPTQVEVGMTNGPPYNCNDVNAGATWGMTRMQVALVGLQDYR